MHSFNRKNKFIGKLYILSVKRYIQLLGSFQILKSAPDKKASSIPGVARKSLHSLLLKQNQAYGKMASNQSEAKNPLQYDI